MAWRRTGDKPLCEPMMVSLLTHICVTRPQWVKRLFRDGQYFQNPACGLYYQQTLDRLVETGKIKFIHHWSNIMVGSEIRLLIPFVIPTHRRVNEYKLLCWYLNLCFHRLIWDRYHIFPSNPKTYQQIMNLFLLFVPSYHNRMCIHDKLPGLQSFKKRCYSYRHGLHDYMIISGYRNAFLIMTSL